MQFVQAFNSATNDRKGEVVPVVITAYRDASFDFITLEPPVADLLKEAAGVEKGSSDPLRLVVGTVSPKAAKAIALRKMEELNTRDSDAALKVVAGTARSMGIRIVEAGSAEEKAIMAEAQAVALEMEREAEEAAAAAQSAASESESDESGEASAEGETPKGDGEVGSE